MRRYQENQLNMFMSTEQVLNDNSTLWNSIPAIVTAVADFTTALNKLKDAVEVQQTPIVGFAKNKRNALLAMANFALQVKGGVMAYAEAVGDKALQESVNFSFTKLVSVSDTISAERCQVIKDVAQPIISQLNSYGITNAMLNQLQQLIDAYSALIPSTRIAIGKRKLATKNIALYTKQTSSILKSRMDKLMLQFTQSAREFYEQYISAREIIDLKSTATKPEAPPTEPTP